MKRAKLPSDSDFQRLIASFDRVNSIASPVRREFEIAWLAPYHGLPRSEFRRIYRLWLIDRSSRTGGEV